MTWSISPESCLDQLVQKQVENLLRSLEIIFEPPPQMALVSAQTLTFEAFKCGDSPHVVCALRRSAKVTRARGRET